MNNQAGPKLGLVRVRVRCLRLVVEGDVVIPGFVCLFFQVLIAATRAIIQIGQDHENMSIMTDYEVVPMLTTLCFTVLYFVYPHYIDSSISKNVCVAIYLSLLTVRRTTGNELCDDDYLKTCV